MASPMEIVDYEPAWPAVFADLGTTLRGGLGDVAARIDHIEPFPTSV